MRRIFALLLTLALVGLGAPSTFAQQSAPIFFEPASRDIQYPVEQETPGYFGPCADPYLPGWCQHDTSVWVGNPTQCVWDPDDYNSQHTWLTGTVDPGQSVTGSTCVIADDYDNFGGDDKHTDAQIWAPISTLSVVLRDSLGNAWTSPPVRSGNGYTYTVCTEEGYQGPFVAISGSNGGIGLQIDYILTVANPTRRTVRSVQGFIESYGIDYLAPYGAC